MLDIIRRLHIAVRMARTGLSNRVVRSDSGEGVISAAIAVLIMALLGAAMWLAFKAVFDSAQGNIRTQVESIGG
jgi:hypothetical protein